MTTREDVLSVARELSFYPTEAEIQEVIERFDEEAENDPSGNWKLWIENLLYNMEVRQVVPPKYSPSNPKPTDDDQQLVDEVIEEIQKDIRNGDLTVLDELLKFIPKRYLIESLPEERWKEFE